MSFIESMPQETKRVQQAGKGVTMLLSELFRKHIQPRHKVLCVGPYDVKNDPSPVMVAVLTHGDAPGHRGRVWLLDRQSSVLTRFLEGQGGLRRGLISDARLRKPGKPLKPRAKKLLRYLSRVPARMGIGDVASYADDFKRKYGEWLRRPVWKVGNALRMPFTPGKMPWKGGKGEKFDVLIDAGSYRFILGTHWGQMLNLGSAVRLMKQYQRVSHKSILLAREEAGVQRLKQAAFKAGAKSVAEHDVREFYNFTLQGFKPPYGQRSLSHDYDYNRALVVEW
mgnify:CR=1 FL=1